MRKPRTSIIVWLLCVGLAHVVWAEESTRPIALDKVAIPFLQAHCVDCHSADSPEGGFRLDELTGNLKSDDIQTWVSALEQIETGIMPPDTERRPDVNARRDVILSIHTALTAAGHDLTAQRQGPAKGNYIPHEFLFGVNPPESAATSARVWRISPIAYLNTLERRFRVPKPGEFSSAGINPPIALTNEPGIRDYSYRYAISSAEAVQAQLAAKNALNYLAKMKRDRKTGEFAGMWTQTPLAKMLHEGKPIDEAESAELVTWLFEGVTWRKPTEGELTRYRDFALKQVRTFGAEKGLKIGLQPIFLHPEALHRIQRPTEEDGRMSRDDLIKAATMAVFDGPLPIKQQSLKHKTFRSELFEIDEYRTYVQQLLRDKESNKQRFIREYFGYPHAVDVFKAESDIEAAGIRDYNPANIIRATDQFVERVLRLDRHVLRNLLAPDMQAINTKPGQKVAASGKRSPEKGLLSQQAWLIAYSNNSENHAIRRGHWVRDHLLGGQIPDVPINVDAQLPDEPEHTLRQRMRVTRESYCWKCHQQMDPLGLPFEIFDHFGQRRETELSKPVDARGTITGSGEPKTDGDVKDAIDLIRRLAESRRVEEVFIRHLFRFYLGRNETLADAGTLQDAQRAYAENGGSLNAAIVSLLTSDAFMRRTTENLH